jgi:exosortase
MTFRTGALLWASLCIASVILNMGLFKELLAVSLSNEFATHIFLMPFMCAALIFRKRSQIAGVEHASFPAIAPILGGLLLTIGSPSLSMRAFGIVMIWIGGFLLFFGRENFRKMMFPLLSLLFMIPIPGALLQDIIFILQKGSAYAVAILFNLTGTPFYRDGFNFILPGLNIEIAPQCSGIRSSLAILISSLLAGHLLLRTWWRKAALVLVAIPLMILKNGIRIAVLSWLAIHVDKRWLTGSDLHRDGGILFFILALMMLFPVLWSLRKTEKTTRILRIKPE